MTNKDSNPDLFLSFYSLYAKGDTGEKPLVGGTQNVLILLVLSSS